MRRAAAFCLDYTLLYVLHSVYTEGFVVPGSDRWWETRGFWNVLFLVTTVLYFFLGDGGGGKTLGKIALRCGLARLEGGRIGFLRSAVRTLCFLPFLLALGAFPLHGPFHEYLQVYFFMARDFMGESARTVAGICFVYAFVSFMSFLVTSRGAFLHDLASGAWLFVPAPSHGGAGRAGKGDTPSLPSGGRPPGGGQARAPRTSPPPIPPDWNRPAPPPPPSPRDAPPAGPVPERMRRSPTLAALLSFVPGLGQLYNGEVMKGIFILFTWWLILPWAYGIVDAYLGARRFNRELLRSRY